MYNPSPPLPGSVFEGYPIPYPKREFLTDEENEDKPNTGASKVKVSMPLVLWTCDVAALACCAEWLTDWQAGCLVHVYLVLELTLQRMSAAYVLDPGHIHSGMIWSHMDSWDD